MANARAKVRTKLHTAACKGAVAFGRLWIGQDGSVRLSTRRRPAPVSRSAFAGFRFPAEVITVAVRWYLRYGLSYRDVEELLAERGVEVDHVTVYRWVHGSPRCSPTRPASPGTRRASAGSSTKPTSKSTASGGTCTGPSTSTGRSSTCSSRTAATATPPAGSSAVR